MSAGDGPFEVQKSFLVQKFAKLKFPSFHVIGFSVAGEETVVQVPELGITFDAGRAPQFALTSDLLCLTHGHMDHIAGLGYFISQRQFQGMKPATILVPRDLERPVHQLMMCWRDIERQSNPFSLVPMMPGQLYEVRRDFGIRAMSTHHGGRSLGYSAVSIRQKLKPELAGTPGQELARMRKSGVEIEYRLEVPLVTFLGDTAFGSVFQQPDVINAQVLITECTFFESDHKANAKAGKHLHIDEFADVLPSLKNEFIVLTHVSRRTGIRRARSILRKKIGAAQMKRILFLMDFEGSTDEGDVQETLPPPQ